MMTNTKTKELDTVIDLRGFKTLTLFDTKAAVVYVSSILTSF